MDLRFAFVPMGFVARPEPGKVYVDVGNAFGPGVLDHHHPNAPAACTAMLVLNHGEYVRCQIMDDYLMIIPHELPDLDAVSGAYFARLLALGKRVGQCHQRWAEYVCWIDRGHTALDPNQPHTPYSLFNMNMLQLRRNRTEGVEELSRRMLESGFLFLERVVAWVGAGGDPFKPDMDEMRQLFPEEASLLLQDLDVYRKDLRRARRFRCCLPLKDGTGSEEVAGLWMANPESALFKSWAWGDPSACDNDKVVFLGIQLGAHRFVLSVNPASNVCLKGLGSRLQMAEMKKRRQLGKEFLGENRPGFDSPDPWYDGRSPLHRYTIVDSPRQGTIMTENEVFSIFQDYCSCLANHIS